MFFCDFSLIKIVVVSCLSFFIIVKDNFQEVDFIIQREDEIISIEVKAEENVKSKSLAAFVNENKIKGVRCSMKAYVNQDWMQNIPLYAIAMYLKQK